MKLTQEQKKLLIEKLSSPYGFVELRCDGYTVTLCVERAGNLKYRVATYINGEWRGEWFSNKKQFPEQKFMRKSVRPLHSASFKASMEKILGKRRFAKDESFKKTITTFFPDFASGSAAIGHLCRVCDAIEILEK